MSNIILFEGTDHCGKTEIATALAKRLPDYQYFKVKQERIHIEKIDPEILKQAHLLQLNFFYEFARQVDFNIIMDRFYVSEFVYGNLFRKIDEEKIWEFDKLFAELGTKIIILQKKDDRLEDELWTKEQLIAIKAKYQEFAAKTKCQVLVLDTNSEDLEYELFEISKFLGIPLLDVNSMV